ncbi:MAG: cyclase family protein, partial [Myxococcota bacterium]
MLANCARLIPALVFAFGVAAAQDEAPREDRGRLVDLTWPFDETTLYWPTEEGFVHEFGTAGPTEGGYYYEAHAFRAAEHGGTHIDAPIHFFAGRDHVDEIPLDRLLGPGVVVDVSTT